MDLFLPQFIFGERTGPNGGSDGSGHAPTGINYPTEWSAKEYYLENRPSGRGHSSPVHDGKYIWVTTAVETPASEEEKEKRLKENKGLPTVTVLSKVTFGLKN